MSAAVETANRALAIYRTYPDYVRNREQSRYLKELAEHVLRLQADLDQLIAVTGATKQENFGLPAPEDYDHDDDSCESTDFGIAV